MLSIKISVNTTFCVCCVLFARTRSKTFYEVQQNESSEIILDKNVSIKHSKSNVVDIVFTEKQKAQIMLLNATGKLYYETIKFSNRDKVTIDTTDFLPGVYFITIDQGKRKYAHKIKIS
ncbi:MAG: T9SS type A sorting domain-containing protein [Bacteroidetes bacterium]|nr:T9SS type A sorting domain-containing protein [Bacteroidota bacterium]